MSSIKMATKKLVAKSLVDKRKTTEREGKRETK